MWASRSKKGLLVKMNLNRELKELKEIARQINSTKHDISIKVSEIPYDLLEKFFDEHPEFKAAAMCDYCNTRAVSWKSTVFRCAKHIKYDS